MRVLLRGVLVLLIGAPAWAALAGSDVSCREKALAALRASSPEGYAIYQEAGRGEFFRSWIDCDASQYDLPTAVHETTHFIAGETDAFPLVGGGAIPRPHEVSSFFPPSAIADRFTPDDFTATYLSPGKASSATDFLYLLDEFNAYSHDLDAAVDLRALSSADEVVDHRDGLAATMAFLAAYVERARTNEPDTWSGLRRPEIAGAISTLWSRAEGVMARSCGIPNFGTSDKAYIGRVCAAGASSAMAQFLGRAPACPASCLEPQPAVEQVVGVDDGDASHDASPTVETETDAEEATAPTPPRHPFAGNVGPRRHAVAAR